MGLVSGRDAVLLGGLAVALFLLLSGTLSRLLEVAHDMDRTRGLQVLPALVILAAVFIIHQQRKRREMRAQARAAAADAAQAGARVAEMERLVAFGHALARSLDEASIRAAAAELLPTLAPDPPQNDHQRGVLATASALLALSLKNAALFRELRDNSMRDALTGCVNRKHALDVIETELRRARRSKQPLSLVMFDLDHFKRINDEHGHLCGDAVLAAVGQRMNAVLRGTDLKCRYGGEEFLILLPDTPLAGARRVADTLRRDLQAHPSLWNGEAVRVTASFGLAAVDDGDADAMAVIARADAGLYRAKQQGRNCVREAEPREPIVRPTTA